MKKLILLLVIILGVSTGCQKFFSESSSPTVFVIKQVSQDNRNKLNGVAQYQLQVWIYSEGGTKVLLDSHWITLQEGLQVGDTLKLTK